MEQQIKLPTIDEVKTLLEDYGWKYRETTSEDGQSVIISPYTLEKEMKGVLLSFRIEGEFVVVNTVGFLKNVPVENCKYFFDLNDTIKLVKLFSVETHEDNTMDVELGFELWDQSWTRETFFTFIDMLCLSIENVLSKIEEAKIPHETSFVIYE